jgi:NADH-quinone oxidoreductase subunit I
MNLVINYFKSLLLVELLQGLVLTMRYYFKPKYTVHYPIE